MIEYQKHCACNLKVAGNTTIETELCKKKCTRKGVNTTEYRYREMCPNETENNHKVGSVGDNCCKGSQKVDLDMAWGI